MWKSIRKEEERPAASTPQPVPQSTTSAAPIKPVTPKEVASVMENPKPADNYHADVAHIGKSVLVKGELSGSEDLYLDGEVEGNIDLRGHSLTIGPNGRIRANVAARDVVVHGKVEGNLRATERVELKKSAVLMGDIFTQRIVIEDGAFFKGGIDIQKADAKPDAKPDSKPESRSAAASPSISSMAAPAAVSASAAGASPMLETKKY